MCRPSRAKALLLVVMVSLLLQAAPALAQVQESEPTPRSGEPPNPPDGGGEGGDADEILIRACSESPEPVGLGVLPEQVSWIVRLMVWLGVGR